ncbi:DUF3997 domain-containing protein [Pseudoalteromonas sp. JC3]|uniref:DUF3997 domain-containing protein n=1 Tax=Pseudoalteromonas sp. JC3 TaxID=2810196 RepID=UPI0019D1B5FD|nr:DUF3997 domain-containing protein [Pseudoalteromonas sp. JC3]MBR8841682.1 hypothetical protein [Pseudoalteromonas sp. JC3]WJE07706.1 DUF3997 domain-containing protein [Pseudoalteromonas sp. JC3]
MNDNNLKMERLEAETKKDNENKEKVLKYLIDNEITYILRGDKFVHFEDENGGDGYNRSWIVSKPKEMSNQIRLYAQVKITAADLVDLALDNGLARAKQTVTKTSIKNPKALNLAEQEEKYWIYNRPLYSEVTAKKNKYIDTLFTSLAGCKEENKKHIEEWIAFKLFNATDCQTLPALNIYGQGGTGKNLFFERLLPIMFHGKHALTSANMKNVGGFNGHWEGKRFAVFNESAQEKANMEGLKQIVGATSLIIEKKGHDAYEAENLMSVLLFTNDMLGSIKIDTQDGVNRRWSIIKCEHTLVDVIKKLYPNENTDDFLEELVRVVTEDEHAVAEHVKWLEENVLTDTPPKAHHGQDYAELKENTKDEAEQILDYAFKMKSLESVPVSVVNDAVKALYKENKNRMINKTTLNRMVKTAVSKRGEVVIKSVRIDGKTVKCYVNDKGSNKYNSALFIGFDGQIKNDLHHDIDNYIDENTDNVLPFVKKEKEVNSIFDDFNFS